MNKYVLILLNLLLPFLHLLIMQRCMKAFIDYKKGTLSLYVAWSVYYVFQAYLSFGLPMPSYLCLTGNIIFVFIISSLSSYSSIKRRCVFSLLVCTVWMLVEVVVVIPLILVGLKNNIMNLAGRIISEMCMLIIAAIVRRYMQGKNQRDISFRYFLPILLIPICSIYLMHNITLIAYSHTEYFRFAIFSSFLLLLISCMVFEVYDWMTHDAEVRAQNSLYEQQLELCTQQAGEREDLYCELRQMRHDMKYHLSGIMGMVQAGKTKDAANYLQDFIGKGLSIPAEEVSRSGNIVVDSLINYKCSLACREGIEFEANIFLPSELPFQSGHLAIVFGNLLDNALEACRYICNGKKYIRVEASYAKQVLFLTITNSYEKAIKKDEYGNFLTGKKSARLHGIGLSSVKQAAACYHGQVEVDGKEGIFQSVVVMYGFDGENDL